MSHSAQRPPVGAVSRANAPHYNWGTGCDGWHLLSGEPLSVIEERMPPGTAEARHRHRVAQQFFYILEGTATMELDSGSATLAAGQGIQIPPGAIHQLRNDSPNDLRFLVVSQPSTKYGDRENLEG